MGGRWSELHLAGDEKQLRKSREAANDLAREKDVRGARRFEMRCRDSSTILMAAPPSVQIERQSALVPEGAKSQISPIWPISPPTPFSAPWAAVWLTVRLLGVRFECSGSRTLQTIGSACGSVGFVNAHLHHRPTHTD